MLEGVLDVCTVFLGGLLQKPFWALFLGCSRIVGIVPRARAAVSAPWGAQQVQQQRELPAEVEGGRLPRGDREVRRGGRRAGLCGSC